MFVYLLVAVVGYAIATRKKNVTRERRPAKERQKSDAEAIIDGFHNTDTKAPLTSEMEDEASYLYERAAHEAFLGPSPDRETNYGVDLRPIESGYWGFAAPKPPVVSPVANSFI